MNKDFARAYYQAEDYFWWFLGRVDFVSRLLIPGLSTQATILDVGCGGGKILSVFKNKGFAELHGIEMSAVAVQTCQSRGLKNVIQGDACQLPYPDNYFSLVIASDILEHLATDEQAVHEWTRVTKPGGRLLIFVPAFKWLWSFHDVENEHTTRYTRAQLVKLAQKQNLKILTSGYWNFWLFVPYALVTVLKNIFSIKTGSQFTHNLTNLVLKWIITFENWLISKGVCFPWGVSCYVILEK